MKFTNLAEIYGTLSSEQNILFFLIKSLTFIYLFVYFYHYCILLQCWYNTNVKI